MLPSFPGPLEPAFFGLALLAAKLNRRLLEKAPLLELPKQSLFLNTAFQDLERFFHVIAVDFNFEQFTSTTLLDQKSEAPGAPPCRPFPSPLELSPFREDISVAKYNAVFQNPTTVTPKKRPRMSRERQHYLIRCYLLSGADMLSNMNSRGRAL